MSKVVYGINRDRKSPRYKQRYAIVEKKGVRYHDYGRGRGRVRVGASRPTAASQERDQANLIKRIGMRAGDLRYGQEIGAAEQQVRAGRQHEANVGRWFEDYRAQLAAGGRGVDQAYADADTQQRANAQMAATFQGQDARDAAARMQPMQMRGENDPTLGKTATMDEQVAGARAAQAIRSGKVLEGLRAISAQRTANDLSTAGRESINQRALAHRETQARYDTLRGLKGQKGNYAIDYATKLQQSLRDQQIAAAAAQMKHSEFNQTLQLKRWLGELDAKTANANRLSDATRSMPR